jgi:hypothetical protein
MWYITAVSGHNKTTAMPHPVDLFRFSINIPANWDPKTGTNSPRLPRLDLISEACPRSFNDS